MKTHDSGSIGNNISMTKHVITPNGHNIVYIENVDKYEVASTIKSRVADSRVPALLELKPTLVSVVLVGMFIFGYTFNGTIKGAGTILSNLNKVIISENITKSFVEIQAAAFSALQIINSDK